MVNPQPLRSLVIAFIRGCNGWVLSETIRERFEKPRAGRLANTLAQLVYEGDLEYDAATDAYRAFSGLL